MLFVDSDDLGFACRHPESTKNSARLEKQLAVQVTGFAQSVGGLHLLQGKASSSRVHLAQSRRHRGPNLLQMLCHRRLGGGSVAGSDGRAHGCVRGAYPR